MYFVIVYTIDIVLSLLSSLLLLCWSYLHETPVQVCRALLREGSLTPEGAGPAGPIGLGYAAPPLTPCSRLPLVEVGDSALKLGPHLPQFASLSLKLHLVGI